MMYAIIGAALEDVNSQNVPTDYLAFFCIGTRLYPSSAQREGIFSDLMPQ